MFNHDRKRSVKATVVNGEYGGKTGKSLILEILHDPCALCGEKFGLGSRSNSRYDWPLEKQRVVAKTHGR